MVQYLSMVYDKRHIFRDAMGHHTSKQCPTKKKIKMKIHRGRREIGILSRFYTLSIFHAF